MRLLSAPCWSAFSMDKVYYTTFALHASCQLCRYHCWSHYNLPYYHWGSALIRDPFQASTSVENLVLGYHYIHIVGKIPNKLLSLHVSTIDVQSLQIPLGLCLYCYCHGLLFPPSHGGWFRVWERPQQHLWTLLFPLYYYQSCQMIFWEKSL